VLGGRLRARRLSPRDRPAALECLHAAPEHNLLVIDQVERLAEIGADDEPPPQLHGVFAGERITAVAALRPSIALSHGLDAPALAALTPALLRVPSGLLKSERAAVDALWSSFAAAGCEALIDRIELAYRLARRALPADDGSLPGLARPARAADLPELVHAARASLWEERRPDPAESDPEGFARWVESRLARARVVCAEGRVVFVAYADVRRRAGWLIQGVYTWPEARRRGYARRGMDAILREAFAAGAAHVQLAVVAGNERASRLYRNLGFEPFAELRTILFR
jgi:ribosomal protein S18 acetylase RimI-like enzyme